VLGWGDIKGAPIGIGRIRIEDPDRNREDKDKG